MGYTGSRRAARAAGLTTDERNQTLMAARTATAHGANPPFRLPALRSAMPDMAWPCLPAMPSAGLLGIHYQLAASERMPPEAIRGAQFRQLGALVDHCAAHAPFWAERLKPLGHRAGRRVAEDAWRSVPVLRRRELQAAGDALLAQTDPPGHGERVPFETSGSTGAPVKGVHSRLALTLWNAITLRDHLWHRRDLGLKFAAIRRTKPHRVGPEGATGILQYQVVETSPRTLEIRVVSDAEIAAADVAAILANAAKVFGPGFAASVSRVASIPRGEGGKYEDFVTLPEAARQAP